VKQSESLKKSIKDVLVKYLPEGTEDEVMSYFDLYKVRFKIVKPRKTKLGDFRVGPYSPIPEITINGNLNKYSFLVTTVHEFAHLKTYLEHKFKVNPHGKEWKDNFVEMMLPIIDLNVLPKDITNALINSFVNVRASSCTDVNLHRVLKKYDDFNHNEIMLEEVSKNSTFVLGDKVFQKGNLRRTRYLCEEVSTKKKYLVNALAIVKLTKLDEE